MVVELTDLAAADVLEASLAYEIERPGLGFRFEDELDALFTRIGMGPGQYREISPGVRRGLLRVFPYAAYYAVVDETVRVFAVLHLHRHPKTWKQRTP